MINCKVYLLTLDPDYILGTLVNYTPCSVLKAAKFEKQGAEYYAGFQFGSKRIPIDEETIKGNEQRLTPESMCLLQSLLKQQYATNHRQGFIVVVSRTFSTITWPALPPSPST